MKIYYAHCMAIYGTGQEKRDIETLEAMGFEVLNPGSQEISDKVTEMRAAGETSTGIMKWFTDWVSGDEVEALAFRALPDGSIPAGVAKEIKTVEDQGKPVIELPSCSERRILTVGETRQYLRECGNR